MVGHQMMTKQELEDALDAAQDDEELKGSLRSMIIERYKLRIAGGNF